MSRPSNAASRGLSLSLIATALVLAGCASGVKLDESQPPVENRSAEAPAAVPAAPAAPAPGAGVASSQVTSVDLNAQDAAEADRIGRVIYFGFDSFAVADSYAPMIDKHAALLTRNTKRNVIVEGHTDERGGSEYNLALGQKRADAVVRALKLRGVADGQLEASSYGKERPAEAGSTEAAYAKNRRAEIRER
ncbi:peptidoglycan-associated lipoprotein Pal [Aquariibacter albus]|uniref:Peptidoglycan-associated lipoprotein n=1 Tax=Aquariibacter albus TaxID=2759899 RepID=A0A839HG73_9BURK|nr:peptidoglycan-associated lipoprotein Pal [Aquariibacter albus]MBB1160563.1 peptidoglycan-associated lipoprotein Pal [Aquariibacter albus]